MCRHNVFCEVEKMKIAVCDDDKTICGYIEKIILNYAYRAGYKINVDVFFSGSELIRQVEEDTDMLFLDIELKDTTGVVIGNYLRKERNNRKIDIVFISAHPEYALDLFKIRPVDFLIKPFKETDVENIIKEYYTKYHSDEEYYQFKNGNSVGRILYKDILYFSSDLRKVKLHKTDGTIIEMYAKLDEVAKKLPEKIFWRIHKSYLVNVRHVEMFRFDGLALYNGEKLMVSKTYRQDVRMKLMSENDD